MTPTRIVLADDHILFREALAGIINSQTDLTVVGQANDGLEAVILARDLKPDLVIIDISMPISDGLEATRLIKNSYSDTRILVLTVAEDVKMLFEAIRVGASGYVLKGSTPAEFLEAVYLVIAGQSIFPPGMTSSLFSEFARLNWEQHDQTDSLPDYDLSMRELEVLSRIVHGASDREIAQVLSISVNTVKTHVRSILKKLNASNRWEAARLAVDQSLVKDD